MLPPVRQLLQIVTKFRLPEDKTAVPDCVACAEASFPFISPAFLIPHAFAIHSKKVDKEVENHCVFQGFQQREVNQTRRGRISSCLMACRTNQTDHAWTRKRFGLNDAPNDAQTMPISLA